MIGTDLKRNLIFTQQFDDLKKTLRVDDAASFLNNGDGFHRRPHTFIHIIGGKADGVLPDRFDQNTLDRSDGVLAGNGTHRGDESLKQRGFRKNNLHGRSFPPVGTGLWFWFIGKIFGKRKKRKE